jgi:serine/threonine-protein kinase
VDSRKKGDSDAPATVAEKPAARSKTESDSPATVAEKAPRTKALTEAPATVADKPAQIDEPDVDALANDTVASDLEKRLANAPLPSATQTPSTKGSTTAGSTVTVAEAMHAEEVRRTRQFIMVGWAVSVLALGGIPMLGGAWWMNIALAIALLWGMALSFFFWRRWADPAKFSGKQLTTLGVFAIINTNVSMMFFGVFSPCGAIMVLGMHFIARSEAEKASRMLLATAVGAYCVCTGLIVGGVVADPGIFASSVPQTRMTLALGGLFVVGVYLLAFYTGRSIRGASLSSIEGLNKQTRLAAQRKALMDELRADLERALRVGGPGRHTDQTLGSFKLGNVIGRGAMGEVYEATNAATGEQAAVKLLRRELLSDATHVARFLRESKASGALASPHVVHVIEASAPEDGTPFLAMELLSGQTLAEMLRGESRLPGDIVTAMVKQTGAGVDAASAAGIVHRDLKPQNLMLANQLSGGQVWKILDFGVATLSDDTGTLTQGGIVGTPSYMAPEQAQGGRVDSRADVYAIAAVAYRCLTGRHPFTAADTPALLFAVVHRMPHRPSELGPFGEDVDRWAAIALAKSPDDRFSTGAELGDSLAMAVRGELDAKLRKKADALIKKHGWEEGV